MAGADDLLEAFRDLLDGAVSEEVHRDGFYHGTLVTYKSGLQLFHPYIPLMMSSVVVDPETMEPMVREIPPPRLLTSEEWQAMKEKQTRH
jgi:hypothetical protein